MTLEDAVSILEKWLTNNAPKRYSVINLNVKDIQEELGFSPSTFWYALMKIQEKYPNLQQPWIFRIDNNFTFQQGETNHDR